MYLVRRSILKKYICLVLALIMALSLFSFSASAQSYILGDADTDGEVTISDATVILRRIGDIPVYLFNAAAADVDHEDGVTVMDASYIQRWAISLSAPEEIGDRVEVTEPIEPTAEPQPQTEPAPTEAETVAPTEKSTEPLSSVPVITSLTNTVDGIELIWEGSDSADGYAVLRRRTDGSWVKMGTTQDKSYVDTTPSSGTEYIYKVRYIDASGAYVGPNTDIGPSILFLRTPRLNSAAGTTDGVKISFATVAGADHYEILRRGVSEEDYETVGTTGDSPYVDLDVQSGVEYVYSVRAVCGDTRSAFDPDGLDITYISAPTMKSVDNAPTGVRIEWKPVAGARYYRIYRKAGVDGNWTPKNVVEDTVFIDEDVYSGTFYAYTVRCVAEDQETNISDRDETGLFTLYLKTPALKSVDNVHGGVRISFSTVAGADSYEIYRASGTDSFKLIGTAQDGSYTDRTVQIGSSYTYKVRACQTGTDSVVRSAWDENGLTVTAEDISGIRYVTRPSIGLYNDYSDDVPALSVKYMTPLKYLETTKEWDSGSWLKVEYNGKYYYLWVGAGETKLTDVPSSFEYATQTEFQRRVLSTALSFLNKKTGYAHEDSTGIADSSGVYWFDCSGFAAYVMDSAMREDVPTYNISANIRTLYETVEIYNNGYTGSYSAQTVIKNGEAYDETKLLPGDVIFFDLSEESEAQADDLGYNHCGVYLGNGEFIHCTHSWGGGVCVMPMSGIYTENFVSVKRYLPLSVEPADKKLYTTSQRTGLYASNNSDDEPLDVLDAEVPVTLLYTDNGNWAYVDVDGRKGYILVKYLTDSIDEVSEKKYVSKTSVKLYQTYDTDSAYEEVLITTGLYYHGRYSNSSYYKVTYNGVRYFIYAKDGIDSVLSDSLQDVLTVKRTATVNANTWLRSTMNSGIEDNKLYLVRTGTQLKVITTSDSGTWSYVQDAEGNYSFILSSKLS